MREKFTHDTDEHQDTAQYYEWGAQMLIKYNERQYAKEQERLFDIYAVSVEKLQLSREGHS